MQEQTAEPLGWCVVANVAALTAHGPDGYDVKDGLKHFPPRAKVWVQPPNWGDGGEMVIVHGLHRGRGRRTVTVVTARRHLTNFRARGIYSRALFQRITWHWSSREQAESFAAMWNTSRAAAEGASRWTGRQHLINALDEVSAATPETVLRWRQLPSWARPPGVVRSLVGTMIGDPPRPSDHIGSLLRDQHEASMVTAVLDPLRAILRDMEQGRDLNEADWSDMVAAADAAATLLNSPPRDT